MQIKELETKLEFDKPPLIRYCMIAMFFIAMFVIVLKL